MPTLTQLMRTRRRMLWQQPHARRMPVTACAPVDVSLLPDSVALFAHAYAASPDDWQHRVLCSSSSRLLLNCARQSGKSTVAALVALTTALTCPGQPVLVVSRALRQSQELFHTILTAYQHAPMTIAVERETTLMLSLANGSRILALPGSEATIRGYSDASLLIIDEASRVPDDLYYALLPMLAVSGGRLMLLSTPFGKRGFFYQEWIAGKEWDRVEVPATQCPRISAVFLAEMRLKMGHRWFNQEFMFSFEDAVGSVFDYDTIQEALTDDVLPLFALPDDGALLDAAPLVVR